MSEAAAAFFANKKRKKKAFKFNANLIDVSSVSQTTHVEAPALSKDIEAAQSQSGTAASSQGHTNATAPATGAVVTDNEHEAPTNDQAASGEDEQQWDEAAVVSRSKTVSSSSAPEVLDMKSFSQNKGSDNISEKLRVEETKAQLAAAREGMEREAARAKAEKERKEQEAQEKEAAKAAAASGGGGIWVSARMRAAQSANLPKMRMGIAGKQQQLDTSNEELFPDLASADKILEQKEKSAQPARIPKKTPVGGGASWATKTNNSKAPSKPSTKNAGTSEQEPEERKAPSGDETQKAEISNAPAAEPEPSTVAKDETSSPPTDAAPAQVPETATEAPAAAVPATKPKTTKKKKKKDLSSFKPGS